MKALAEEECEKRTIAARTLGQQRQAKLPVWSRGRASVSDSVALCRHFSDTINGHIGQLRKPLCAMQDNLKESKNDV